MNNAVCITHNMPLVIDWDFCMITPVFIDQQYKYSLSCKIRYIIILGVILLRQTRNATHTCTGIYTLYMYIHVLIYTDIFHSSECLKCLHGVCLMFSILCVLLSMICSVVQWFMYNWFFGNCFTDNSKRRDRATLLPHHLHHPLLLSIKLFSRKLLYCVFTYTCTYAKILYY